MAGRKKCLNYTRNTRYEQLTVMFWHFQNKILSLEKIPLKFTNFQVLEQFIQKSPEPGYSTYAGSLHHQIRNN